MIFTEIRLNSSAIMDAWLTSS